MKLFSFQADTMEQFEALAARAKALGATHINVSELPRSFWMWERDRKDPYPNWCMGHAQLFKLVCPPALEKYLPQAFIRQCFDLVKARCDVLRNLGLEGALFSNEPFWLPEAVYRDHPAWRGARCDHPRRSTKPYYSPCVDQEEVLDLYRWAMKTLCEQTGISFFSFMSNDSGGGLCWSNGTYAGPNGPEACRHRPMSDRVCGFVQALSDGARDGGVQAVIHFNTNIPFKAEEIGANVAWHNAGEGQIINGRDRTGARPIAATGRTADWIKGIPNLFAFAQTYGAAEASKKPYEIVYLPATDLDEDWAYLKQVQNGAPATWSGYVAAVRAAMASLAGESLADTLTDAMYHIYEGELHFSHDGLGLIMYGCVHQRWINRPFVLFPEELTPEERDYYRPFQFQALGEEQANDLLDMQNIECARGFSASFLLSQTALKAENSFRKAIGLLEQAIGQAQAPLKDKLKMLVRRLEVYICLIRTCANASQFQTLKDRRDLNAQPPLDSRWPTRNDPDIELFQNITRAEIDNAYRLAGLIEGHEAELFHVTDAQHEDIFVFGPDLAKQIRRKAEIMLDHQLDANRVFERHNI